ncbi:hypothetical protein SCP_1700180 [Sparassis crispa]|uniref:Uncharacterized protein n=1 Tax=Sparassis crispa TaxID=139825 RepID=A0A401H5J7_9APHY|nr:hypothetical protein SCP_1700180 [Sparassis crispa]GBE89694.1 hypothetical protein SCP_1700180 [Sparassis crispa]
MSLLSRLYLTRSVGVERALRPPVICTSRRYSQNGEGNHLTRDRHRDGHHGNTPTSDGQGEHDEGHLSSGDESISLQKSSSSTRARAPETERQTENADEALSPHECLKRLWYTRDRIAFALGFEGSNWSEMKHEMEKQPDFDWPRYAHKSLARWQVPLEEFRHILSMPDDFDDPADIDRLPALVKFSCRREK